MADDNLLLNAIQTGANIGNMRVMRQERMMELQAQAAMNAVHERQLNAQADMLAQHAALYKQQALKDQEDALTEKSVLAAAQDHYNYLVNERGMPEDQATPEVINAVGRVAPKVGDTLAQSYERVQLGKAKSADGQFTPQVLQPKDLTTGQPAVDAEGRPIKMVTTGRGSAAQLDKEVGLVAQLKHINQAKLDAQKKGDTDLAKLMQAGEAKLVESNQLSIEFDADGKIQKISQGPAGNPEALTKANQTKMQEGLQQSLNNIDVANRLEPLIDEETIGGKAFAESWIKDRILAQAFPELASEKRAKAEQLASQLRASAVKELRSDGNISDKERNQILQSVPQINAPADSPAHARQLIQASRTMSAVHAMTKAKILGVPVPKSAALVLDDEEIVALAEQGLITRKQVEEAWKIRHTK